MPVKNDATLELTINQRAVLTNASLGYSYEEMAHLMDLSINSVHWHSRECRVKLGALTITEAVAIAIRDGLIE